VASGSALLSINVIVALRRARLVLGWVTADSSHVRTILAFSQPPRSTSPARPTWLGEDLHFLLRRPTRSFGDVRTFREKRTAVAPCDVRLAVGQTASRQVRTGTDYHPARISPTVAHRMTSCTGHNHDQALQFTENKKTVCKVSLQSFDITPPKSFLSIIIIIITSKTYFPQL